MRARKDRETGGRRRKHDEGDDMRAHAHAVGSPVARGTSPRGERVEALGICSCEMGQDGETLRSGVSAVESSKSDASHYVQRELVTLLL